MKMFYLKRVDSVILPIHKDEFKIGRHTENDIVVNVNKVSRFHSELFIINNELFIQDNTTVNGTYIGDKLILPGRKTEIRIGDTIGIGFPAGKKECTFEVVKAECSNQGTESRENVEVPDSSTNNDRNGDISSDNIHPLIKNHSSGTRNLNEQPCNNVKSQEIKKNPKSINMQNNDCSKNVNCELRSMKSRQTGPSGRSAENSEVVNLISSSDDDLDVKAEITDEAKVILNYSTTDEIISLMDSEDEDFMHPSQFDTTNVIDVPDYSHEIYCMYNQTSVNDGDVKFINTEDPWFEPLSQSVTKKKLVVDLPIISVPKKNNIDVNFVEEQLKLMHDSPENNPIDLVGELLTVESSDDENGGIDDENDKFITTSLNFQQRKPILDESLNESVLSAFEKSSNIEKSTAKNLTTPSNVIHFENVSDIEEESKKLDSVRTKYHKKRRDTKPCIITPLHMVKKRRSAGSHDREVKRSKLSVPHSLSNEEKKHMRSKKLKKIADKQKQGKNIEEVRKKSDVIDKPIIKDTSKNRSAQLLDEMVNNSNKIQPRRKEKNRQSGKSLNEKNPNDTTKELEIKSLRPKFKADKIYDSYPNDILVLDCEDIDICPSFLNGIDLDNNINSNTQKQPTNLNVIENKGQGENKPINSEQKSLVTKKRIKNDEKRREDVSKSVYQQKNNCKLKEVDLFSILDKSNLIEEPRKKKSILLNTIVKNDKVRLKKTVTFNEKFFNLEITHDPKERKNNISTISSFKLSESLIKDEQFEFEFAISVACKWNVKWLEEQQRNVAPPPGLYIERLAPTQEPLEIYKERLRKELFLFLWRTIFNSWNKPNQDYLPLTQNVSEKKKNMTELAIENVEASNTAALWTIQTSRITDGTETAEVINGQIGILRLHVMRKSDSTKPTKTMMFVYIASVTDLEKPDGTIQQRITFKTYQKDVEIMTGEAKLQILTYTKYQLRPFQGLAMVPRSPIANLFIDPSKAYPSDRFIFDHKNYNLLDSFLENSQREAIITGINCIASSEPSVLLVNGPPGTGKTQVLISFIHELFSIEKRKRYQEDLKVLIITSYDHLADDICLRLRKLENMDESVALLRYDNRPRNNHKIKEFTLESKIQNIINKDEGSSLVDIEEEKRNVLARINSAKLVLESESAKSKEGKLEDAQFKLNALQKEYEDLIQSDSKIKSRLQMTAARNQALEEAGVIVTSMSSCWTSNFEFDFVPSQYNKGDVHKLSICIFDDADCSNEIGMLIPITIMARSLILIGDSRNQPISAKMNVPFLRLTKEFKHRSPSSIIKLNTGFRMNNEITQCVNACFGTNIRGKQSGVTFPLTPIFIISLVDKSGEMYDAEKKENQTLFLVSVTQKVVEFVENEGVKLRISVIVADETDKIVFKNCIQQLEYKHVNILLCTLNEIRGRETDIVLVGLPLQSHMLDQWAYAACTRARFSLIICGHFTNLRSPALNLLYEYAKEKNIQEETNYNFDNDFPFQKLLSDVRKSSSGPINKMKFYSS